MGDAKGMALMNCDDIDQKQIASKTEASQEYAERNMRNKQTCDNLINKYVCRTRSGIEFCTKMYTFNTGVINMCVRHHTYTASKYTYRHIMHFTLYNTNELSLGD